MHLARYGRHPLPHGYRKHKPSAGQSIRSATPKPGRALQGLSKRGVRHADCSCLGLPLLKAAPQSAPRTGTASLQRRNAPVSAASRLCP